METTYYTLNAREIVVSGDGVEQVSGGARQLVCVRRTAGGARPAGQGKVIDLEAWRAERESEPEPEEWDDEDRERDEAAPPTARTRRSRGRRALAAGELLASLTLAGVALLLAVQLLGM